MSWFSLRVPASSANLGPGFDALGLALGIYLVTHGASEAIANGARVAPTKQSASSDVG